MSYTMPITTDEARKGKSAKERTISSMEVAEIDVYKRQTRIFLRRPGIRTRTIIHTSKSILSALIRRLN